MGFSGNCKRCGWSSQYFDGDVPDHCPLCPMTKTYEIGFRTRNLLNGTWRWRDVYRYKREAKAFTAADWRIQLGYWRPRLPCKVTLTRIAPRKMDSHDNLRAAMKPIVDTLAAIIGVDDGDPQVTWDYDQARGEPRTYAVRVEIKELGT